MLYSAEHVNVISVLIQTKKKLKRIRRKQYNYQTKWGPICDTALFQPAAHIWGPSTAIAKGMSINRDSIERQA